MGKQYLRKLLYKAIEYINDRFEPESDKVEFFYRCKSEDYFREVKENNNVMKPIRKDFNGDPKSPINGKLKGVFLGVDLRYGNLPDASPFGDIRVAFPIRGIFTEGTSLYFTDFYCTVSHYHYVTLVLTKTGSPADDFCNSRLLQLEPYDNPFLWRQGNRHEVVKSCFLHVEVFYAGRVELDNLTERFGSNKVFYERIGIIGKGSSTWGGLLKNSYCDKCNPTTETPTTSPLMEDCLTWPCQDSVITEQKLSAPVKRAGLLKNSYCNKGNRTSESQTTSPTGEDCLSWSRKETFITKHKMSAPVVTKRLDSEHDSPKSDFQARSDMLLSTCESCPKPWWFSFARWKNWVVCALFFLALCFIIL